VSVYDSAHALSRALKSSEEYKAYQQARAAIEKDEGAMWVLRDFRKRQMELEMAQAAGQKPSDEKIAELNKLAEAISLHKQVTEFLMQEMRLLRLVADVQKIMGEALDLLDYLELDKDQKEPDR